MPIINAVVVNVTFVTIAVRDVGGVTKHLLGNVVGQHQRVGRLAVILVVRGARGVVRDLPLVQALVRAQGRCRRVVLP